MPRAMLMKIIAVWISTLLMGSVWHVAACAQVANNASSQGVSAIQSERTRPDLALSLALSEFEVRDYIDTCVTDSDRKSYFFQLSQRYVTFLVEYGRISQSDIARKPPPDPNAKSIDCVSVDKFLARVRKREASVRDLLASKPPTEPPPPTPMADPAITPKKDAQ